MVRNSLRFLLGLASLLTVGCTSISSTLLSRDEGNGSWQREQHLPGVPITLKVPTHVKVYVVETYYLQQLIGATTRTERLKLPFTIRDFAQEFVYTEKIFTVDFKRPAAGKYNLHLGFTTDQYIQKVEHDVTDETIRDVSALIAQLTNSGGLLPRAATDGNDGGGQLPLDHLYEVKSVVAVGLFEIDAQDFEQQLGAFVNCHLTQAHDAWVVPPGVDAIHRVPLSGYDQDSNLCCGPVVPQGGAPSAPGRTNAQGSIQGLPTGIAPQGITPGGSASWNAGSMNAVPPGGAVPNTQTAWPQAPIYSPMPGGPSLSAPRDNPSGMTMGSAPLPGYAPASGAPLRQPAQVPAATASPFRNPESHSR